MTAEAPGLVREYRGSCLDWPGLAFGRAAFERTRSARGSGDTPHRQEYAVTRTGIGRVGEL